MTGATIALVLAVALAGCATQADLLRQERKLTEMMQEQTRSMDDMRRELERLREDVKPGRGSRAPTRVPTGKAPAARKDTKRAAAEPATATAPEPLPPSAAIGETPSPEGTSIEDPTQTDRTIATLSGTRPAPDAGSGTASAAPASAPVEGAPSAPSAPSAAPIDEDWRREVAQERAVASASPAPDRAEYLGALDRAAKGDCARMKAVAGGSSPLSDNAIYWQGKCLAARGDQRKAEARLNEVVARYPKSDKAPAALWTRGQLQLRAGNAAAARGTLARLIRDYPASAEAAKARKTLAELSN